MFNNFCVLRSELSLNSIKLSDCPRFCRFPIILSEWPVVNITISNCPLFDFAHFEELVNGLRSSICLTVKNFNTDAIFPCDFCPKMISHLCLENCPKIRYLPERIHKWPNLISLGLIDCLLLQNSSPKNRRLRLEALNIKNCPSIDLARTLSTHIHPQNLKSLEIGGFHSLVGLPLVPKTDWQLEWLSVRDCASLRNLPNDFHTLPKLRQLSLEDCPVLEFRTRDFPLSLCYLSLTNLDALQTIDPYVTHLVNLIDLDLEDCHNLVEIHAHLPSTSWTLSVRNCASVKTLTTNQCSFDEEELWITDCPSISWMSKNVQEGMLPLFVDFYDRIPVADVLSAEHMTGESWFSTIPLDVIRSSLEPFFEGASFVRAREGTYDELVGSRSAGMNID